MRKIYTKGDDYKEREGCLETFGIDERTETDPGQVCHHFSLIEVYGDGALRDKIIDLLNKDNKNG